MSAVRKDAMRTDQESMVARVDPVEKNVVMAPSGWYALAPTTVTTSPDDRRTA